MEKITKADLIRALVENGLRDNRKIAELVGTTVKNVATTQWLDDRPGYHAGVMANKRKNDPAYRERERQQQRQVPEAPPIQTNKMKINGEDVVDATSTLEIKITKDDVRLGAKKNATACAAAVALCRQEGFTAARVHVGRTYVKRPDGKWMRYLTPKALRSEIVAFDRGGQFEPGDYKLMPLPASAKTAYRAKFANRSGTPGNKRQGRPKRKPHVTTGVRQRFNVGGKIL